VVSSFDADRGRARVDAAAALEQHARETARQRQRIDVPSASVPEAAEPGIRSQHLPCVVAGEQIDRGTEFRPLSHPPLGDLDASGRVYRLNPAGLFLLGLNLIAPREIEQDGGAVTHQTDKTFTRCPMPGND